jgi:putative redox protein
MPSTAARYRAYRARMTLLENDTRSSVPAASAHERAARLTDAGSAWGERIAADTSAAHLTYKVSAVGVGSVASRITVGRHEFVVDEPSSLAGDDVAPSPVEFALGALISCQIVVYRLYAQALGIVVDEITINSEGELDARKLFGIEETVRPGFGAVRLDVAITGPESLERYEQLRAVVDEHCPVLDLFTNATPVEVSVRKV